GGASSAASSVVMPGVPPFAPYDDQRIDPAAESLSRLHEWVGALDRYLRLPNSFQAFSVFLLGLLLVFAGAMLQVWVAARIMQAEYKLASLEREYIAIEQQNSELLFMIARDTNLNRMRERAVAMGYVPIDAREYVVIQPESLPIAQTAAQPEAAHAPMQAQTNGETLPLHQWERLLRGEVTWERPAATQPARDWAASTEQPAASGVGWQVRWQQLVEQGRQLFTKMDIH